MPKKGTLAFFEDKGGIRNVQIAGCSGLHIETQAELDALIKLVNSGQRVPLRPAPGQKPRRK